MSDRSTSRDDPASPAGASAPVGLVLCLTLGILGPGLVLTLVFGVLPFGGSDSIEKLGPEPRVAQSADAPIELAAKPGHAPPTDEPPEADLGPDAPASGSSREAGSAPARVTAELDQLLAEVRAGGDVSAAVRALQARLRAHPEALAEVIERRRSSTHRGEQAMLTVVLAELLEEPRRAELFQDLREDRPESLRLSTLAGLHRHPRAADFDELESELRRARVDPVFLRQAGATLRSLIMRRSVRDAVGRRCRDLVAGLARQAPDSAVRAVMLPLTRIAPNPNQSANATRWGSRKSRRRHRTRRSGGR